MSKMLHWSLAHANDFAREIALIIESLCMSAQIKQRKEMYTIKSIKQIHSNKEKKGQN